MEYGNRYLQYQAGRGKLRRLVRMAYLYSAQRKLAGATLDFGCGIGDLLSLLPNGSKGVEYNASAVEYCRQRGLDVAFYDGESDEWSLSVIPDGARFESMVISHVLEHLSDPIGVLRALFASASKFGVDRVLVVVPGKAGFRMDHTHVKFVDAPMLLGESAWGGTGFEVANMSFFPVNIRRLGDFFRYQELQVLYRRR